MRMILTLIVLPAIYRYFEPASERESTGAAHPPAHPVLVPH